MLVNDSGRKWQNSKVDSYNSDDRAANGCVAGEWATKKHIKYPPGGRLRF